MKLLQSLPLLLGAASLAAALLPREALPLKTGLDKRAQGCSNGPNHRDCWYGNYDINTDYENEWPNTGNIREVRTSMTMDENLADHSAVHPCHSQSNTSSRWYFTTGFVS
jgi:hypothetical protein